MGCCRNCFMRFFLDFFYPIYSVFQRLTQSYHARGIHKECRRWLQKWEAFKVAKDNFEEVSPQVDIRVCNKYGEWLDFIHVEFANEPLKSAEEVFSRGEAKPELMNYVKFFLYHHEPHTKDMLNFLERAGVAKELPLYLYFRNYKSTQLYVLGVNLREETYAITGNNVLFGDIEFDNDEKIVVAF